jgi:predicted N-acetyltransferase YhbS
VTTDFLDRHLTYVALEGGEVVAFYALSSDGDVFELEHMWVDPRCMRRGVGALLFRHAVDGVRTRGGSALQIASDPNAEGFYVRMGARRVGEIDATPAGRTLPFLVVDLSP